MAERMTAKRRSSNAAAAAESPAAAQSVRVSIFDQAYHLRGTDPAYIERLAEYVDSKIRAVASQANTVDTGRLAVLAALNIADELFVQKRLQEQTTAEVGRKTERMAGALDDLLSDERKAG